MRSHISFTQFLPMVASYIMMIHCQNQEFSIRTRYVCVFISSLIKCVDSSYHYINQDTEICHHMKNPICQMCLHICAQQHCFGCVPRFSICCILIFIKFNAFFFNFLKSSSETQRFFRMGCLVPSVWRLLTTFSLRISEWIPLCSDQECPLSNFNFLKSWDFRTQGITCPGTYLEMFRKCVFCYYIMSSYHTQSIRKTILLI